jgi:integrase
VSLSFGCCDKCYGNHFGEGQDVDLIDRTLTVRRATTKTDAGERIIPLNADAWSAILELRGRIKTLCGTEPQPDWYVFPHAEGLQNPDPTKPMSGWRTAWRNLTRAVQCPACGLLQKPGETCRNEECAADIRAVKSSTVGFRFHDLRHHAITELAESQTGDQVIMSIAGHVSGAMLRHYSHVRLEAKRRALDALSSSVSTNCISAEFQGCCVTNPVTIEGKEEKSALQTAEKIGGREGIRTPGLLVANEEKSKLRLGATIT